MRTFILLSFVSSLMAFSDLTILNRFKEWVNTHNFEIKDNNHMTHVLNNWVENDEYINEINNQKLSYTLGHNAFSGYNSVEFSNLMGFEENNKIILNKVKNNSTNEALVGVTVPSSVDWRTQGVVNPVRDQGQCGSCWTFSATQAIESGSAIKYGKLNDLSEQELVDCDNLSNGGRGHGCNGGLMDDVFNWVNKKGGQCSESAYPYVSGVTKTAGTCAMSKCTVVANSQPSKYVDVQVNSDSALMTAIAQQPVAIAIEADQKSFQLYTSGVFTGACGTNLDHGVGLVGYSSDYYILRNSWGTSWGNQGYMYLGKGNDPATGKPYNNGAGQCGVLMEASYPVF
jgi:C1A family cysteine protease